jgi:hypothetical protein
VVRVLDGHQGVGPQLQTLSGGLCRYKITVAVIVLSICGRTTLAAVGRDDPKLCSWTAELQLLAHWVMPASTHHGGNQLSTSFSAPLVVLLQGLDLLDLCPSLMILHQTRRLMSQVSTLKCRH